MPIYSILQRQLRSRAKRRRESKSRRMFFEPLEPRVMLAADFVFEAAEGFRLKLTGAGTNLLLVDAESGNVVQSQPLAENSGNVVITGSSESDTLIVGRSLPALEVVFDGGDDRILK